MKKQDAQLGASTMEMLIAFAILVLALSAVILVTFTNQSSSVDIQTNQEALAKASADLETARNTATTNYDGVVDQAITPDDIYQKQLIVTDDTCFKQVTSRYTWTMENRPLYVELSTILTNPALLASLGGDCNTTPPPPGPRWRNPKSYSHIDIQPGGNSGTGLDFVQRPEGKTVFLSSKHSAQASHDFWIFDVRDPRNPSIISSLNTGVGLNDIDVGGNYAYVAHNKNTEQVQVIDVTDLTMPAVVANITLPVSVPAQEIHYFNNRIYVGTNKNSGAEFFIYNVTTPSAPVLLGIREIGEDVNDIVVRNNFAYLATSPSGNNPELRVLNVSNPASMSNAGTFNAAGNNHPATTLHISGNILYLGRESSSSDPDYYVLNISNPAAISVLGSKNTGANPNTKIEALAVAENLAFMGTSWTNHEFQIWTADNPANIQSWSYFNFPANATGMEYDVDYIYVSVNSNDALHIIYDQPR